MPKLFGRHKIRIEGDLDDPIASCSWKSYTRSVYSTLEIGDEFAKLARMKRFNVVLIVILFVYLFHYVWIRWLNEFMSSIFWTEKRNRILQNVTCIVLVLAVIGDAGSLEAPWILKQIWFWCFSLTIQLLFVLIISWCELTLQIQISSEKQIGISFWLNFTGTLISFS